MPQPPIPSGGPISQRTGDERWPSKAARDNRLDRSPTAAAIAPLEPPPAAARRQGAVHWRDIQWFDFETGPDAAGPAKGEQPAAAAEIAAQPARDNSAETVAGGSALPAAIGSEFVDFEANEAATADLAPAPAAADDAAAEPEPELDIGPPAGAAVGRVRTLPGAGTMVLVGAIVGRSGPRRWRLGAAPRRLKLAAAAAAIAALAAFAYLGGDRLAALAGATVRAPAAPAAQSATVGIRLSIPPAEPAAPPSEPPSDPVERAGFFLERAKAGDAVAQYNIAVLYARGEGLVQDFFTAAAWFREAAISGNPAAQFNLGVLYERGLGVQQSMNEAVAWYRRAAERDYSAAQYNLAVAYAEGRGVPRDRVTAAMWYHRAAEQGLVRAMINFAILYEQGDGVERSLPDAYAWYRAAAQRDDATAGKRAGELLQQFAAADRRRAEALAASVAASIHEPPPNLPRWSAGGPPATAQNGPQPPG
jgi:uncharacterized protein